MLIYAVHIRAQEDLRERYSKQEPDGSQGN